jgi:type I restriction enzyme S subunit
MMPLGWSKTKLEDFADIVLGQSPPSSSYNEAGNGLPFYQGKTEFGVLYPSPKKWCTDPHKIALAGDVLISVRAPVGPTNLCQEKSCIGRGLAAVRGRCNISPLVILYLLRTFEHEISSQSTGTTFDATSGDKLRSLMLPLPPLPEQHRIVSKVEELFNKLDAGVEELHKIKAQLKRYRQAVLKAAFQGKLTEEWRRKHKGELEAAAVLIEKIGYERKKSGKYKALPTIDITDLPELPKEWVWTTLNELSGNDKNAIKAGPFGSSLKKDSYVAKGYKVYGQEQVISGNPLLGNYYINEEKYNSLISCSVKPGDLLISLVGTIGKVLILPDDVEPGIINPRLAKLSLDKNLIVNKYIKAYLESSAVRHFFSLTSHGGTMDILNLTILKALPIPLPSVAEQDNITDELARILSVADEIDKTIGQCLKEVNKLRQSVLKLAFDGKLVPQDPSDEPAEKLLERIKVARSKEDTKGRLTHAK